MVAVVGRGPVDRPGTLAGDRYSIATGLSIVAAGHAGAAGPNSASRTRTPHGDAHSTSASAADTGPANAGTRRANRCDAHPGAGGPRSGATDSTDASAYSDTAGISDAADTSGPDSHGSTTPSPAATGSTFIRRQSIDRQLGQVLGYCGGDPGLSLALLWGWLAVAGTGGLAVSGNQRAASAPHPPRASTRREKR
jgi:hypothetical protein